MGFAGKEDEDAGERNRKKDFVEFIPLGRNTAFFDGEPRGFPYMSLSGWQRSRDYTRLDLFFPTAEGHFRIIVTGRNLNSTLMGIRVRSIATVMQVDSMQAATADKDAAVVEGLAVEMVGE